MTSYTLYYFNGRGRAEICRMLFALSGVEYDDSRITFTDWKNFRSKMPCSCLPVLEIDRKVQVPQSMAIARYLAREFGFHGKDNIEMTKVEYIADSFYDIFNDYMRLYHDRDGRLLTCLGADIRNRTSNSAMRQSYEESCKRVLPYMEELLDKEGYSFFLGNQIKLCDLMCYASLENPLSENPVLLNDYPKIRALRQKVASLPQIKEYLRKRDYSEF